jgi:sec-independent protein translocase protein TatA
VLADEGEHAAMVVGVGVDVEQGSPAAGQRRGTASRPSLTFIALQHGRGRLATVNLGAPELLIILLIILLVFGGSKLRSWRSLGQAQKEFKAGTDDANDPSSKDAPPRPEPPAAFPVVRRA